MVQGSDFGMMYGLMIVSTKRHNLAQFDNTKAYGPYSSDKNLYPDLHLIVDCGDSPIVPNL